MKNMLGKILFAFALICGMQLKAAEYDALVKRDPNDYRLSYIKIGSQGGLCGFVTLQSTEEYHKQFPAGTPYKKMQLVSYYSAGDKRGGILGRLDVTSDSINAKNSRGEKAGIIIPFDWAGSTAASHYRIYLEGQKADGTWEPVDIFEYIKVKRGKYKGDQDNTGTKRSCVLGYAVGGIPTSKRIRTNLNLTNVQVTLPGGMWYRPHEFASDPALLTAIDKGQIINMGNPNGDIVGTLFNNSDKKIYVSYLHTLCDPQFIWDVAINSAVALGSIIATVATAGAATAVTAPLVIKSIASIASTSYSTAKKIQASLSSNQACGSAWLLPGQYALMRRWHPGAGWAHQTYILTDVTGKGENVTGKVLAMQGDIERDSLAIWDGEQLWFATDKYTNLADIQQTYPSVLAGAPTSNPNYQRVLNFTQGGKQQVTGDRKIFKASKGSMPAKKSAK